MATKVEKRSERREKLNGIDAKVKSKSANYEESVESLKKGSVRWIIFFVAIFLIWVITKFQ